MVKKGLDNRNRLRSHATILRELQDGFAETSTHLKSSNYSLYLHPLKKNTAMVPSVCCRIVFALWNCIAELVSFSFCLADQSSNAIEDSWVKNLKFWG